MSGFGTAIQATVGADVNPLRKAGAEIVGVAGGIAGEMAKKFEMKDLGRTLATALGLNLQTAANALVTPFRESAEAASKIADYTERSANATQELIKLNQTNAQVLAGMERDAKRLADEMKRPATEISLWRQALGGVLLHMGAIGTAATVLSNSQENAVKAARDAAALAEQALRIAAQRKKHMEEESRRALEIEQEQFDYVQAHREELEIEARILTATLLPGDRERLAVIRLQAKATENQREQTYLLAKPQEQWTKAEKERFAELQRQSKQIATQIEQKKNLVGVTGDLKDAEKGVSDEIGFALGKLKSFVAEWTGFKISVTTTGRGDKDLSDRELMRKIKNLKGDLFQQQVQNPFAPDYMLGPYQFALESALGEQQVRATNRRNVAAFGDDRAFAMSGMSEQRWAAIMRESQDKSEATQELRDLNENVRRGFDGLAQSLNNRG